MAILIAESGSTKTDWRLITIDGKISQFKTLGFNPFYQNSEEIFDEIEQNLTSKIEIIVEEIYYYGTGITSSENAEIIKNALKRAFGEAKIEINDDMCAAARALCINQKGVACILGTGANSCYFDGEKITEQIKPLGFWLGDEGSGGYLGKILITKYLRNELSKEIETKFIKKFGNLSRNEILDKAYKQPLPNRYFASFSKFIFDNRTEPDMYLLVFEAFKIFIEKNVLKYIEAKNVKINFTGSVAFYYSDILRKALSNYGLTAGVIMESPIAGLVLFHNKIN